MQTTIITALEQHGLITSLDDDIHTTLVDLFNQAVESFGDNPAYTSVGHTLSYTDLGQTSRQFACYLQQHTSLQPGDRIAIQLPNLIQYPVVLYGALMAGMVVVNTNPMYTGRELEHQLKDSGAKAIVVLANIADTLADVVANSAVEQVIVTELADLHPMPKRWLINTIAKYIKRMVPAFSIKGSISLRQALAMGQGQPTDVLLAADQLAILQYTGGTTGVAKGAMLSHRNLVANTRQSLAMFSSYGFKEEHEAMLVPLPLYHIYSFTTGMLMLVTGNHSVLIPDPRDTESVVSAMAKYSVTAFCGLNTLFVKLCSTASFKQLDFSRLKMTLSGGMALTADAAKHWHQLTGCEIYQGYGLTETSPVVTVNPGNGNQVHSIGLPVPDTEIKLVDDVGQLVALGEPGELCVRGPQLMMGYWQRPEATAEVIDSDGFFHTGDVAMMQDDGYFKIVDRKKDMILVSGFNVYPNELDGVLSEHPAVLECAAVGVADDVTGEAVKMFVVLAEAATEQELKAYCKQRLAAYKVPRLFEFRDQLPKSSVGKILRRELR
ncbi:MAG: long-chain acyl-CoA synthetase [Oceanicoccus sp.]|jgi:long-chain acyl-CoA synthetase